MNNSKAPTPADFNQLVALYNNRRYAELEGMAGAMVKRFPASGFVWKLLGAAQQMQGKNALEAFSKAAMLLSKEPDAHFNLGVAQKRLGLFKEAAVSYRRALKLNPKYAEAYDNLGNVLKELGQYDDSVASFRKALSIKPGSPTTYNNLGAVLKELGQLEQAVENYQHAVALKPDYADAYYNLGNAFMESMKLDDAVTSFRKAVELRPSFLDAHNNLGGALKNLGQLDNAEACYRRFIELEPNSAEAYNNLGTVLAEGGKYNAALTNYRRALDKNPEYADAYNNLGSSLKSLGQLEEAIANYRRAIEIQPDLLTAQSNLLFTLNYSALFPPHECLADAKRFGRMVSAKVKPNIPDWQCEKNPQRLRVGMVSGDFRNHPVGYFLESLLSNIDPNRIELIAYPSDYKVDALTDRIKPCFSAWHPLYGLSDEAAARLIHSDGVHVLIDLSGHSRHGRLPVFSWKPAPVQTTWLGYFATTGMSEMNYMIADKAGVPEANRDHFTETVWYLPDTRLCFTPPDTSLPVSPLPALQNSHITFGCYQNMAKVGCDVMDTWASVLSKIPNSRLRWQCHQLKDNDIVQQWLQRFQQYGIDPNRISLLGSVSREAYLASHSEVDILLDTFPYPGGTTTCEALWMGVPTLTLAGDTLLSRQGVSMLTSAGLPDWIADSQENFVTKAVTLSGDVARLADLRGALRDQVRVSPLFDAPRFAHNLEDALWGMWQTHCQ